MKCVLCDGGDFDVVAAELRYEIQRKVVRCRQCGLSSLENPQDDSIDYRQPEYRQEHGPVLGRGSSPAELFAIMRPFQEARVERVGSLLKPECKVLEVGCATGHFLDAIRDRCAEVTGVEPHKGDAAFARTHCGLNVVDEPLETSDLPREHYDIIFLFQVFEHIADPLPFLALCRDHLVSGGAVYLEVPNVDDALVAVFEISAFRDFYYRLPHVYYYSPETLRRMMEAGGFPGRVRTAQYYSLFNHVHWLTVGAPQPDQTTAHSVPEWVLGSERQEATSRDIREFMDRANREYGALLESRNVADRIAYCGYKGR